MEFKILKKLTIVSLVILALPFFQTCSDKEIMNNGYLKNSPLSEVVHAPAESIDGKQIYSEIKEYQYTSKELAEKKRETVDKFLALKNDLTSSGYELGFLFIKLLNRNDFFNSIEFSFLPFFLTQIITVLLIYFSFKRKAKVILILSVLNILFLLADLIMMYGSDFLEDIDQIKFGYYLFVINLSLISIEAYKLYKVDKYKYSN